MARQSDIWELIDPSRNEEIFLMQPLPPQKAEIRRRESLTTDEARSDAYTDEMVLFNILQKNFHKKQESLVNTSTYITKAISPEYVTYIIGKDTPYQILRALQEAVAPDPNFRIYEVDRQYKALCAGLPRGENVKQWLVKWEQLYAEATSIGHADVLNGVMLKYFVDAIGKTDPSWARTANHELGLRRLRRERTVTFMEMLNLYRQVVADQPSSTNAAYPASLNGQEQPKASNQEQPKASNPAKPDAPPRECVCGSKHWYSECK